MSEEIKKVTETTGVAEPTVAPAAPIADALADKIRAYGGDDAVIAKIKDLGAETVDDLVSLEEADLTGAGMKLVKARKMLSDLKTAKKAAEPAPAAPRWRSRPTIPFCRPFRPTNRC